MSLYCPIPSGAVTLRAALALTCVLTAMGLAFAFLISVYSLLFAFAAWIIMVAYTTVGKRSGFAGNLLVSACVATPFLYGSLVASCVYHIFRHRVLKISKSSYFRLNFGLGCYRLFSQNRLMSLRNRGAIQRMNLSGMLVPAAIGIDNVQKNGRIEIKNIAAPIICAFLMAA